MTVWSELPQVADDYVVHARGFTIGDDIHLDAASLRLEHHRWWNDHLRHHHDAPEWPPGERWPTYADREVSEPSLYWSINGNNLILLQHPRISRATRPQWRALRSTFEALSAPPDALVRLNPYGRRPDASQKGPDGPVEVEGDDDIHMTVAEIEAYIEANV